MADYNKGRKAEADFIKRFGGVLTNPPAYDLQEYQMKDIDVDLRGTMISVKHHFSSQKTGNLAFELLLWRSEDEDDQKPGNYVACGADKYAHLCFRDGEWYWFLVDVRELKQFVGMGEKWKIKPLSVGQKDNGARGYNRSACILVPIDKIVKSGIGEWVPYE